MPQSGSYYYPQLSVANSSYPTVDARDLGSTPQSASLIGKFFSSGSLPYYISPEGVVILLSGTL